MQLFHVVIGNGSGQFHFAGEHTGIASGDDQVNFVRATWCAQEVRGCVACLPVDAHTQDDQRFKELTEHLAIARNE